jgi:CheY-like chemotaxis protein
VESLRTSLAEVFSYLGYRTRCAVNGLAALIEIRQQVPDILLSDLNMPAMSGFELLSVIHRRFPAIYLIAMSGMITEGQPPAGVTAHAFHRKGSSVADLVKIAEAWSLPRREDRGRPEPIWIQRGGHDALGRECVKIACPDCFRISQQDIDGPSGLILDTKCIFCGNCILYAIVGTQSHEFLHPFRLAPRFANPAS